MALANVTQEISRSADEKAAALKAEADAEIAQIQADADRKIAELKKKEEQSTADEIARLDRQEMSSAELESKKIVLAKKKEIMSQVYDETLSGLENAPADVKLAQYKSMVEKAKQIIDNPKALMSESDSFSAADLGVSAVETDSRIKGGLILQSEDGSVEVDMQYSTLLQEIWSEQIKAVNDIL